MKFPGAVGRGTDPARANHRCVEWCRARRTRSVASCLDRLRHPGQGDGLIRRQRRQDVHTASRLMSANQTAIACAQEDVLGAGRLAQRLLRLVAAHTTAARGDARHRADRVHPASCPSLVNGHAIGGRGGIRTHGWLPIAGFQDRCNRPLCHPSEAGRRNSIGLRTVSRIKRNPPMVGGSSVHESQAPTSA